LCLGLEVFLLDEPTQGVDVGAREEIHRIMTRLIDEGKGIVMVTSDLDELSPQSLLAMLTSSDVARGKLVGEEKLNGKPVKHYVIDGDAFLAAAQKSKDEKLRSFGESLWSAEDADLYLDAVTGLPVAFRGAYSGAFEPLKFQGDFGVDIA
jgi:ABC-type multidrug transport system ATPase subunit